ncbi:MAG: cobalamin biosynthesis protein [Coriobacteriia bacterium]|nr:cobalamin biosynthesis protein [Coriobacteriia bacterium]
MLPEFHILCFTDTGEQLGLRLVGLLCKEDPGTKAKVYRVTELYKTTVSLFATGSVLVFIGSAGIAVRAIAPYVKNKSLDPAVIVLDEAGEFVIPIISGHLGGANRYARSIGRLLDATPVITTATDVQGVFSFDAFASEFGYVVLNPPMVKHVASAMLKGETVGLCSDFAIDGKLPDLVSVSDTGKTGVVISLDQQKAPFAQSLKLYPKCYHLGIGSRKGIGHEAVEQAFDEVIDKLGIPRQAVSCIASIDLKQNEAAIKALAQKLHLPFKTYQAAQLDAVAGRFEQSEFVYATTGTRNVCEAAAYLSSDYGEIIQTKTARAGVTLAVARQNWRVSFENHDDRA